MASGVAASRDDVAVGRARTRLRCWGDFSITDGASGADLRPRGRKARALLAYLALHPGKPVSRERLTGLLWGDRPDEQARASLRQSLLELKPFNATRGLLRVGRDAVTLDGAALSTDIDELRQHVAQGAFGRFLDALPEHDERLFANLDGLDCGFDDWLAIERAHRSDELTALIADAAEAARGREASALRQRLADRGADPGEPADAPSRAATKAPAAERGARWGVALLLAILLGLGILLIGGWQWLRTPAHGPVTVAVLPFTDLSDPPARHFADGLSEEIMARLGREPGLRVAGRSSVWQFKDGAADLGQIRRRLGVSHVLEGSVRSTAGGVRVNVSLVQAADGLQLWAESFEGAPDELFAIQDRIGARVASRLSGGLVRAAASPASAPPGQVYTLYLTARGLIRERNPASFDLAREKLRQAVALDPGFAPAWSSLAQADQGQGQGPGALARAWRARSIAEARRALALAPDLAEAHGVLGMILGFETRLGANHIERAAALDPYNAEFQFWLGHVRGMAGDFRGMLAAYRRSLAIDPAWNYAQHYVVQSAWRMGERAEALAVVRQVEADGSRYQAHLIRAALADARGDFSSAAAEYLAARAATRDPGKQVTADFERGLVYAGLGLVDEARRAWASVPFVIRLGLLDGRYMAARQGRLPDLGSVRDANRRQGYSAGDKAFAALSVKLLINAGRAREVAALYDGDDGVLGVSRRGVGSLAPQCENGPLAAAALRGAGRKVEAERLLAVLDRSVDRALRRNGGRVLPYLQVCAAQTWALQGRREAAVRALDAAFRSGWSYVGGMDDSSLPDIADEPAFRPLRGVPRFEALRRGLQAKLARERDEIRRLPI